LDGVALAVFFSRVAAPLLRGLDVDLVERGNEGLGVLEIGGGLIQDCCSEMNCSRASGVVATLASSAHLRAC